MKTINKIITKVNCRYGAPMGRSNVFPQEFTIVDAGRLFLVLPDKTSKRIFNCAVPMLGAYDIGGTYWGLGKQLRVKYTKDLSYVEFYRLP